jgi:hypothetical protein
MASFIVKDLQSQIQVKGSQSLLDPAVLQQLIPLCVRAVKEDLAREKRMAQDLRLTAGMNTEE